MALFRPPFVGIPPCSGRLLGYRLTQTALYRDAALLRPADFGIPPYSDRLISGYRLTQTALYRDTALLRPPCIGMPPLSDCLVGGPLLLYAPHYDCHPTGSAAFMVFVCEFHVRSDVFAFVWCSNEGTYGSGEEGGGPAM